MKEHKARAAETTEKYEPDTGMDETEVRDRTDVGKNRRSSGSGENAQSGNVGARIVFARKITLFVVLVAVLAGLAFDCGLGTPSSFGIGGFFLLCPLGGLEAMLASGSFLPISFISLAVLIVISLVFGRAWCSWGCPVPPVRRFFRREPKTQANREPKPQAKGLNDGTSLAAAEKNGEGMDAADVGDAGTNGAIARDDCRNGCSTMKCRAMKEVPSLAGSFKYIGRDRRTWVLAAVLVITLVAGFPVFCLICPIGLTFGTVGSLWHFFVDKQTTASLVVFPLALAIEVLAYRKWCLNLCPIGGLLAAFGQFARKFRPNIAQNDCLRKSQGKDCAICRSVCPEHIDLHAPDAVYQLGECSRCGECVKHCPGKALTFEGPIPRKDGTQ